ncbi:MAG: hypothetical protein Q6L50_08985 [Gloeomargarita sp. GMQP_bins_120]
MPTPTVVRAPRTVPTLTELAWGWLLQALIAGGMLVALTRLWPYYCAQRQRQQLLQTEVSRTETQVQALQHQFQRIFDPRQQSRLRQAATQQLQPNQRLVIWVTPQR